MARGIIKGNNGPRASTSINAVPVNTGTLEDVQTKVIYNFEQPLFDQLGLAEGVKVNYSTIKDSTGAELAIGLESIERGVVQTVTGEGGTLKERASGSIIDFAHPRTKEVGIAVGSIVKYEKVDFGGKNVAASVILIK